MNRSAPTGLLAIDLPAELSRLLAQIPAGQITIYGALAEALGDRVAARWIGEALLDHPHDPDCACHRVVRKNGEPGQYIAGDSATKLARLAAEGVPILDGRAALDRLVTEFDSPAPLRRLQEFQERVPSQLDLRPWHGHVASVAALDVAYVSAQAAIAACVVCDAVSRQPIRQLTLRMPVTFPYVSGYLAFRELPVMWALWQQVVHADPVPDIVIIDGNGILHPRRAGIAACFGLLADVPTIGIGKSLLCGCVDLQGLAVGSAAPVMDHDDLIGLAVKSTARSRPIYVSPGNHCDPPQAAAMVRQLFSGHRLPEPLHLADRLTKHAVRETRRCATASDA